MADRGVRVLLSLVLLSLLPLSSARDARAQVAQPRASATTEADSLFREGRRAAVGADYARACAKFLASQKLDPSTGTLLNLGDCEEHQAHLLAARNYYQTALEQLGEADPRVPHAKDRLAQLEERLPRLTLVLPGAAPPGAIVSRDGVPVAVAAIGVATPVDPGDHVVVVAAPGHAETRESFRLSERQSRVLVVSFGSALPPFAPGHDARAAFHAPAAPSGLRTAGWLSLAAGVSALALAGVSGVILIGDRNTVGDPAHCDAHGTCDSAGLAAAESGKTWLVVNTAAWATAIAGLAVGTTLLLWRYAPDAPHAAPEVVELRVTPVERGATITARGSF